MPSVPPSDPDAHWGRVPRTLSDTEVRARLEFLSDLGRGLLESGEIGGQVGRTLDGYGRRLGLDALESNTFGRLLLVEATISDGGTVALSRAARSLELIDCTRSRELNQAAEDAVERVETADGDGATVRARDGIAAAVEAVQRLRETSTPWWVVCLGMTLLAFFISMQVGVTVQAWISAALVQCVSSVVGFALGRLDAPKLFAVAAQSCAAGAFATLLVQLGFVDPVGAAAAIAVNWLLLLPLPQVIGAVADAIEADQLSSLTRIMSVAVTIVGIFIGGAFTFTLGEVLGMDHPSLDGLPSLPWYLVVVFCALAAIANAFANGGGLALVLPAAVIGLVTGGVNQLLVMVVGLPALWASSFAAIALGALCAAISIRTAYPQQVLALMGVTGALLPGLPVFFGILREMAGLSGIDHFGTAGGICLGIGTGVALGSYLARCLRFSRPRTARLVR